MIARRLLLAGLALAAFGIPLIAWLALGTAPFEAWLARVTTPAEGLLARASAPFDAPKRAPARHGPKAQALFLNEPFRLGDAANASCRVSQVKSALFESGSLPHPGARVRPDVRALEVSLRCDNGRGEARESREVLPDDSVVLLELGRDKTLAPRPQTALMAHDSFVFDLPDARDPGLPSVRRFDANSGKSVVAREQTVAKLSLRTALRAFEVSLRQRYQDAAFDALLDPLVLALAQDLPLARFAQDQAAEGAARELSAIYRDVRARFQPARIELTRSEASARDAIAITLSLTRPRSHANAFEVARFELTLARASDGALRVASFDNRDAARAALTCDALQTELARALRESQPKKQDKTCNALGLLLPSACNEVAAPLLARALAVGARCGAPFSAERRASSRQTLPADFQLTLRRGRAATGLDRAPRYVVALFHGGQVVFHGKHWVDSQERSDGRTDPALLLGLYERLRTLDFFARRGGEYAPDRCSPTDDQGDVITVVAGDKQRMVLNRAGCRGPFSEGELTELRRHVEQVAGISAWIAQGASFADQEAEQWAVAE